MQKVVQLSFKVQGRPKTLLCFEDVEDVITGESSEIIIGGNDGEYQVQLYGGRNWRCSGET